MSSSNDGRSSHRRWAELRFSVVGPLFAAPPEKGKLRESLEELSTKSWLNPITNKPKVFGFSTIERWYYRVKKEQIDPLRVLTRNVRRDQGQSHVLNEGMIKWLEGNYSQHPSWSYRLHVDNLYAWVKLSPARGPAPSYSAVVRFMGRKGYYKKPRARSPRSPAFKRAQEHRDLVEVRSFESEYVGAVWHLDFHHGSRQVVTSEGKLVTPLCLCIIDDYSRLVCHAQWFVHENTKSLVHAFIQALQKIGLPRALASDNGSAMIADEFTEGLGRLGILHPKSQPHCPYQNGKIEAFWGHLEGRLMAMLEHDERLSLQKLNHLTQVWLAREYNIKEHSETGQTPMSRHVHGKGVLRGAPDIETLQNAFRRDQKRTVRQSDGTISLRGLRFEVPQVYRTLKKIFVRYARWDLSRVHLVDPRTEDCLAALFPIDLVKNAEGLRRTIERQLPLPLLESEIGEPPLLTKMIEEFAATGLPAAYIPLQEDEDLK